MRTPLTPVRTLAVAGLLAIALTALAATPASAGVGDIPANFAAPYTPPATALPPANGDLIFPTGIDPRINQPVNLTWPFKVEPRNLDGVTYTNLPYAKDFHLLMYRTTDAKGTPIPVTGMLIRSKASLANYPTGSTRPLVAYAPGNQGMADICGSSYAVRNGAWYENSPVNGLLSKGFDVVVPDYSGLGIVDGRLHPVGDNIGNGHATLDALRAAWLAMPDLTTYVSGHHDALTAADVVPSPSAQPTTMAVWGYSEGGGAAAWAAGHLAYAHDGIESKIKAVAAGGVTADLQIVGRVADGWDQPARPATDILGAALTGRYDIPKQDLDGNGGTSVADNYYSALMLMAVGGFEAVYKPVTGDAAAYDHSQFDLTNRLTSDSDPMHAANAASWLAQIKTKCLVDGIAVAPFLHVNNYIRNVDGSAPVRGVAYPTATATAYNPLNNTVWRQKFVENNPAYDAVPSDHRSRLTTPLYLYHGSKDISVAYPQAVELRERWCATDASKVYWRRFLNDEHIATWGDWASPLNWVQQRLYAADGRPNNADTAYPANCGTPNIT